VLPQREKCRRRERSVGGERGCRRIELMLARKVCVGAERDSCRRQIGLGVEKEGLVLDGLMASKSRESWKSWESWES